MILDLENIENESPVFRESRALQTVAALLLLVYLALYLAYVVYRIWQPDMYSDVGIEGMLYSLVKDVQMGKPLYDISASTDFPFAYPVYPPLFYYITAAVDYLIGGTFAPGRLVSFLSIIGISFFTGSIVKFKSGSLAAGIVSGLLFLCFKPVLQWSAVYRVDNLAIFFSMAGLWWYFRFEKSRFGFMLCVLFFVASVFTKHSTIAIPASLCLWLLFSNVRRAFLIGGAWIGITLVLFFAGNSMTHGGLFYYLVEANKFSPVASSAFFRVEHFFSDGFPVVLLSLGALYVVSTRNSLFEALLLGFTLFKAAATVGYPGATMNYFIEFCVACTLVSGLFIGNALKRPGNINLVSMLIIVSVFLRIFFSSYFLNDAWNFGTRYEKEMNAFVRPAHTLKARIGTDGKILSQDTIIPIYMGLLPEVRDLYTYNFFVDHGVIKCDRLKESIENRKWDYIVVKTENGRIARHKLRLFTDGQLESIYSNYRMDEELSNGLGIYAVFVPAGL